MPELDVGRQWRQLDLRDLRVSGTLMLGAAVGLPLLPAGTGLPCPLRTLTGVPCPFCGMTTSVVATVHLHLGAAVAANPVGVVAVAVALLLLIRPRVTAVRVPVWLPAVVLAAMWIWELHRFSLL